MQFGGKNQSNNCGDIYVYGKKKGLALKFEGVCFKEYNISR